MKKIMILDGHSVAFRAFHAVPPLTTSNGTPTNVIFGFVNMLTKLLDQYKPDSVYVAFDLHQPTFRHLMYSEYKAGRQKTPDEFIVQIDILKELLSEMGVHVVSKEGFEADDVLGTLSAEANEKGYKTYLVTGDRDSFQLIGGGTTVLYTKKGVSLLVEYDEKLFEEEYGIKPSQFVDCKALMGDSSDNIPGVPGIGPKTAEELLQQFMTLDGVYENVESIKSKSVKEKLSGNKESAYMSQTLARIVRNAPVELVKEDESAFYIKPTERLCELLKMLEMNKLLNSLKEITLDDLVFEEEEAQNDVSADEILKSIKEEKAFSLFLEKEPLVFTAKLIYKPQKSKDEVILELKSVLEDAGIKKYVQDIKSLKHAADELEIVPKGLEFDYSVAAYLLDAVGARSDIDYMAGHFLGENRKNDPEALSGLKSIMEKELSDKGMSELYQNIEFPLINVLYAMEKEGFAVDTKLLEELGKSYDERIEKYKSDIYALAGGEFNINSTKQLGEVLFEKLSIPPEKKTKTGYSTDSEVLETLADKGHEIAQSIIAYRQLAKLKSTYIDGLIAAADGEKRIHTTFNQTVTNTGRLSSTEPNLQNIPVRTEEGAQIRRAFVCRSGDYTLVDADYSQIELRMFAHLSGDESFIKAFVGGEDIHRKTAADVNGVSYEDVTDEMRSRAKAVNFGIIYGISDFGLAKNLSVSRKEAKEIIDNYLERYPTLSAYMQKNINSARTLGYCTTIFGRRRYCPEINSKTFMIRQGAERIAINMPVQGAAADIIKLAMIKVYDDLKAQCPKSRLLLQVHDELIVEAHKSEVEDVKRILKEDMENAVALSVPLVADIGVGENWNEAK